MFEPVLRNLYSRKKMNFGRDSDLKLTYESAVSGNQNFVKVNPRGKYCQKDLWMRSTIAKVDSGKAKRSSLKCLSVLL